MVFMWNSDKINVEQLAINGVIKITITKIYQSNMKVAKTLSIQYCTLYCVHCSLLLLMITNSVSLMPADEEYNHDENSGSGNDSYVES